MKRILPLILVLTLAACGDTEDPSTNNGNATNNNQPDQGNNNQPDMTTDMNNTTPDMDMSTTPDMDMNVTPDQGMDMNNGMACAPDDRFKGQIGGPRPNDGGTLAAANSVYAADAGIEALWTLFETKNTAGMFPPDDPNTMGTGTPTTECNVPVELSAAEQVKITGAVITSTSFSGRRITIQDQKRAFMAFFDTDKVPKDANGANIVLKVGQTVNFTVTHVKRYACSTPQISQVSGLEITKETSDVYATPITDRAIDPKMDAQRLVKIGGKITAFNGGCGGEFFCYNLTYGSGATENTVVLRTNSMYALKEQSVGECVTYVGPVNDFPGYFSMDPGAQLNSENFYWVQFPFRN